MHFGSGFKKPSKKTMRLARAARGEQMFEAEEIRQMLKAAGRSLKAMILLAINCGFGTADCGKLPISALDLPGRWLNFPRPKTGIVRRCPLWPETVKALQDVLARRREPADQADAGLVFVTRWGAAWTDDQASVTKEMAKLVKRLGINRRLDTAGRRNFYSLRHTFETIGGAARDPVALDHLMGHGLNDLASLHR